MLEFWLVVGCVMVVGLTIFLPISVALGWLFTHEPPDVSALLRRYRSRLHRTLVLPPPTHTTGIGPHRTLVVPPPTHASGTGSEELFISWVEFRTAAGEERTFTPTGALMLQGVGTVTATAEVTRGRRFNLEQTRSRVHGDTEASGTGGLLVLGGAAIDPVTMAQAAIGEARVSLK